VVKIRGIARWEIAWSRGPSRRERAMNSGSREVAGEHEDDRAPRLRRLVGEVGRAEGVIPEEARDGELAEDRPADHRVAALLADFGAAERAGPRPRREGLFAARAG
jgi:hypothetical protein